MTASAVEINEKPRRLQLFIPERRTAPATRGKYRPLPAFALYMAMEALKGEQQSCILGLLHELDYLIH